MHGQGWAALILASVLAASAAPSTARSRGCGLNERSFVGDWSSPAGDEIVKGDVWAIAFSYDGGKRVYNEWLHFRPMGSGTWRMKACSVVVDSHGSVMRFGFLGNDGRRLVELPYARNAPVFRRIK